MKPYSYSILKDKSYLGVTRIVLRKAPGHLPQQSTNISMLMLLDTAFFLSWNSFLTRQVSARFKAEGTPERW